LRLLLDTNIFLEILLEQKKHHEARSLLEHSYKHDFFLSDFSLHSIGLLLFREKKYQVFSKFIDDILGSGVATMLALHAGNIDLVSKAAKRYQMDFDDAYQYALAEQFNLNIVSFDKDFDKGERGRRTPAQIINL